MSNLADRPLRVEFRDLEISPECNDSGLDLLEQNQADHCHVLVTVTDRQGTRKPDEPQDTYRLRFDRKVDGEATRFELSIKQDVGSGEVANSQEAINWFFQHTGSLNAVLDTVRVMGTTLDAAGVRSPSDSQRSTNATFPLVIANYIVTGRVVFPGDQEKRAGESQWKPRSTSDLEEKLLDVFANSPQSSVQDFIGKIGYFKADKILSPEARNRAVHVDNVLIQVPRYKQFLNKIVPEEIQNELDLDDPVTKVQFNHLQSFVAKVIINLNLGKYFLYDEDTYLASEAFKALVGEGDKKKDFCLALKHAEQSVNPHRNSKLGEYFLDECRSGLKLSQMPTEKAAKESIRHYLKSARGLKDIKDTIPREVRKSRMTPDWLAKRGQIGRVTQLLLDHTQIKVTYAPRLSEQEGPQLPGTPEPEKTVKRLEVKVDGEALQTAFKLLIQSEKTRKHREPLMATLGVLRFLFGKNARNDTVTVLLNGEYQEVPLKYDRGAIQEAIRRVEQDLKSSFVRSEVVWPIVQGVSGGLGVTALGLGLGLKQAPKPARQGLFIGGCSAAGFALGSLVNRSKRAKNKHIWGAVGGTVGMVLLGGACTAVSLTTNITGGGGGGGPGNGMDPDDMRNPVDEYGP